MLDDVRDVVATCNKPGFWSAARERDTVFRALKVAAVVGSLLVLINQGEVLLRGALPPLWKLLLTYCVPYGVSTYSAASFKVSYRRTASG